MARRHPLQPNYSADWADFVSFAEHLRNTTAANGQDLLLVDSGDRHDGNGLSDATEPNGVLALPIFLRQEYDIVAIGNHELYLWENTVQELEVMVRALGDRYISSNVEFLRDGKLYPVGRQYRYFKTPVQKRRVLAFSFLFNLHRVNNCTKITPVVKVVEQSWFKTVLEHFPPREVDVIVVTGHLPVSKKEHDMHILHSVLRAHYRDTPIQYFGGHSHIRDFLVLDETLTGLQSGSFCETVGFLSLNMSDSRLAVKERFFRSYIDFNLDLFQFHTNIYSHAEFDTKKSVSVRKSLREASLTLNLDAVIGNVSRDYYMYRVPLNHPQSIYALLTEQVLPMLEPDSSETAIQDERVIILHTGAIRYDLYRGSYTVNSRYILSPFKDVWMKSTVPKSVAVKIIPVLQHGPPIFSAHNFLVPPHQRYLDAGDFTIQSDFVIESDFESGAELGEVPASVQLNYGYVTYDDFGNDGDDTPHRRMHKYWNPTVVACEQLGDSGDDALVDVIYLDFMIPDITRALRKLGLPVDAPEEYSGKHLGDLIDAFAASGRL
ncbi:hypothetical protein METBISCDRAFT_22306 [Metschnikowia bicuspidata]|uniref:Uncharacterized protein n=1 Tax=Metschnikowia bicuspidata TaxID=27322 RepID=A0A4P9ZEX2_9ASCO|nr:hypothetical protein METBISCDRAFT_22306 [Metschnikowia bicuspidata]